MSVLSNRKKNKVLENRVQQLLDSEADLRKELVIKDEKLEQMEKDRFCSTRANKKKR